MLQSIQAFIITLTLTAFTFADVLMTELTDPQNSSDAGRYVELYNNGDSDVDLSFGWALQRWTNANSDPQEPKLLTGNISAGGFYIICNNAGKFSETYGFDCDQDINTGGAADSNGDDNVALLDGSGVIVDMFGVAGEDGSGTGHEFEDGRAERAEGVCSGSAAWSESEWNIDNDSGGGDGNQYAPEGFDPGAWIGSGFDCGGTDSCGDGTCADDEDCSSCPADCGDCDPLPSDVTFDIDGVDGCGFLSVTGTWDGWSGWGAHTDSGMAASIPAGDHEFVILCVNTEGEWWNDIWGNSTIYNAPIDGSCWNGNYDYANYVLNIDGSGDSVTVSYCAGSCDETCPAQLVNVTFSVDMSIQGVAGDIKVRTSTVNGEYSPSDWSVMDDSDADLVYTYTLQLETGTIYGYNFNNSDGSGYESGAGLGDCAGGNYGNDRFVTPGDSDITLDTVCWESCEGCPAVVEGCTDETATNYDPDATVDDGTCEYEELEAANLFISEAAEGSSNHKYIEIYNASNETVDLASYAFANTANAPSTPGEYEYWTPFDGLDHNDANPVSGSTSLAPGDVYVVCDNDLDATVIGECDQYHAYLSNGDDGFCLVFGSEANFEVLDCVGDWNGDGAGAYAPWDVAGVSNATKNHTLVRKASVGSGNGGDWASSAGTDVDDSEWVVLDQNTWDYLGSHPHDFAVDVEGCMDPNATNYDPEATVQNYNEYGTSLCTYESCETIPTEMGCLWGDGTSSEWWEGWWNCAGGQVCGLHEVIFELNLPDGVSGTPHVNGTYNGWCGSCYNAMSDDGDGTWSHVQYFGEGEVHDYKFTIDGWNDQEDLTGLECAVEAGGYWNRQFTTGGANTSQTQTYCWESCETTCETAPSCGDGTCSEDEDCSSCPSDCGECPSYSANFTLDGIDDCDWVSITGTFDGWSGWGVAYGDGVTSISGLEDGSTHEFIVLCAQGDGWWYDIWGSSTILQPELGSECDLNPDDEYANYGFTVNGGDVDVSYCAGSCEATCSEDECIMGDVAGGDPGGDGSVDVLDIVSIVGCIVDPIDCPEDIDCADANGDGAVNVLDVVALVSNILGSRFDDATSAKLIKSANGLKLQADGYIGGVQMTLRHDADFTIKLSDNAWISDYSTKGNQTILIIVEPAEGNLFTASGDFEIVDMIIANSHDAITVMVIRGFSLSDAYPNPFNPSTTVELTVPEAGHVSVMVYNITGQLVAELADSYMDANQYQFTWQGENVPSGMYLLRAEYAGQVSTQKLMLLK